MLIISKIRSGRRPDLISIFRACCMAVFFTSLALGVFAQSGGDRNTKDPGRNPGIVAALPVVVTAPNGHERPDGIPFNIPISVGDISTLGIYAFQFNLTYDPTKINPTGVNFGCTTAGTLAGNAGLGAICNVTTIGTLRVGVSGVSGMTGSGTIIILKFASAPTAVINDVSPLNFSNVKFYNSSGSLSNTPENGDVTLDIPLAPTAAGAVVGGQVLDGEGRAISRVEVVLTDGSGFVRRSITSPFGYFRFENVPIGSTYVINASSKRFTFQPRVVTVNDDIAGLDLVGVPN